MTTVFVCFWFSGTCVLVMCKMKKKGTTGRLLFCCCFMLCWDSDSWMIPKRPRVGYFTLKVCQIPSLISSSMYTKLITVKYSYWVLFIETWNNLHKQIALISDLSVLFAHGVYHFCPFWKKKEAEVCGCSILCILHSLLSHAWPHPSTITRSTFSGVLLYIFHLQVFFHVLKLYLWKCASGSIYCDFFPRMHVMLLRYALNIWLMSCLLSKYILAV